LYAIDYVRDNPGTIVDQFREIWKKVERENNETLKVLTSFFFSSISTSHHDPTT
jgi:hypothetical protein